MRAPLFRNSIAAIAMTIATVLAAAAPAFAVCDSSDYRTTISDIPCPIPREAFPMQVFAHFNNGTSDGYVWPRDSVEVDSWRQMPTGGTVDSFTVVIPGGGSATVCSPGDSAYIPIPGTNCTLRIDYKQHGSQTSPPGTYLCPHIHIIAICPPCGEEFLPKEQVRMNPEISLMKPRDTERP